MPKAPPEIPVYSPIDPLCAQYSQNLWFPGPHESAKPAKAICAVCPDLMTCRDHGVKYEREGIWGGLTESERRSMRRRTAIVVSNKEREREAQILRVV